jgi:hypothetical protein
MTQSPADSNEQPVKPETIPPIKLPDSPEETQPETPKVGSRDAPGG